MSSAESPLRCSHAPLMDENGLILPRKLENPCLYDDGMKKLRKELLFNEKTGRSVLGRKSELQQAWERHQQHARQKEREEEDTKKTTEFQRRLNDQAAKINKAEEIESANAPAEDIPEFLKVHARVKLRST